MTRFSILHRVLIDDEVHAYRHYGQSTVCGKVKIGRPTPPDSVPVTCMDCVNMYRANAIRQADSELGFPKFPEIEYAVEVEEVA